jgi:hypothetical protein
MSTEHEGTRINIEHALKTILTQHFTQSKLTYIAIDGKYILFKTRTSKPPMNAELLAACYAKYNLVHLKRTGIEHESDQFAKFCATVQNELSTQERDIVISDKIPLCSLFK